MKKGNKSFWPMVWLLGLAGQMCWNIENQWFNTFVYAKIAKDSNIVTAMVVLSALITTASTFLFGTMSDRRGSRRRYVSIGYIAWGALTIVFGFTEFIQSGSVGLGVGFASAAAVSVVLADCVMSFFGSMGNDTGFNAWSNDHTGDRNRGQIGAALATQPVIGVVVGTVVGGMLIGENDNYQRLFWVMGLFVIAVGILSLFVLRDAPNLKPHVTGSFAKQFFAVFSIGSFLKRRELLMVVVAAAVYFTGFNIYFVHMGNWLIYYLGFTPDAMGIVQGGALALATLAAIPGVSLINGRKTPSVTIAAVLINIVGLLAVFLLAKPQTVDASGAFAVANLPLIASVFVCGVGYILTAQSLTMWTKELYPEENKGQFEGVRILFFVLLPMFIGTLIGNVVVKTGAGTVTNAYGIVENIPTESIFLWAAVVMVITLLPAFFAGRHFKERENV